MAQISAGTNCPRDNSTKEDSLKVRLVEAVAVADDAVPRLVVAALLPQVPVTLPQSVCSLMAKYKDVMAAS
jgi:hypothetical protein